MNILYLILAVDIFTTGQFVTPNTYEISVSTDQPFTVNALDVTVQTDGQFVTPVNEGYVLDTNYIFQMRPPISPILTQTAQDIAFNDFAFIPPTLDQNPVMVARFDILLHGEIQWDGVLWDASGDPPQVFSGAVPEPGAVWLLGLLFLWVPRFR